MLTPKYLATWRTITTLAEKAMERIGLAFSSDIIPQALETQKNRAVFPFCWQC